MTISRPLIAIVGATGTGKSNLAVKLACKFGGEIINADAVQLYRGLDIITNKVTEEEMEGVPHHLLGCLESDIVYTVKDFVQDAQMKIEEIRSRNRVPIIVGGTNYYIQSLLWTDQLVKEPEKPVRPSELQLEAQRVLENGKPEDYHPMLQRVDVTMSKRWNPKEIRKVQRSLEVFAVFGVPHSEILRMQKLELRYPSLLFWIHCGNETLYPRLDGRIEKMLERGMMTELQEWHDGRDLDTVDFTRGVHQAIGVREFSDYFKKPSDEAFKKGVEMMKIATRRYAKKQVQWIATKLRLVCEKTKPQSLIYALDGTNLDHWSELVKKAERLTETFFGSLTDTEERAKMPIWNFYCPAAPLPCRQEIVTLDQWDIYSCEVCDKSYHGIHDWQIHLNSRGHKSKVKLRNSPNWPYVKKAWEEKKARALKPYDET